MDIQRIASMPSPSTGHGTCRRLVHALCATARTFTGSVGRWPRLALLVAMHFGLTASTVFVASAGAVQITEFPVATGSRPNYITAGPDGNMWFTDVALNKIGRITPAGQVSEFGVGLTPSAELTGITAGPDGNVWFTERKGGKVGRITPGGIITEFSSGITGEPRDVYGITSGPGGKLWFTETSAGRIGAIDPATGEVKEFSSPSGVITKIVVGPDGNLWYTNVEGTIDRMTPAGSASSFGPLPTVCASGFGGPCPYPESITVGPDGNMWFDESHGNALGRVTTGGAIAEYTEGLSHGAAVGDLAPGPDGNVWFTERTVDQVGRVTPSGVITEYHTGITPSAQPFGIALGPDGNLWFAEWAGMVARLIPDVPPIVTTGAATGVSSTAATVSGTVRSRGADTHYDFEYGLTTAYGQATPLADNGGGDNTQTVSAALANLQPGLTYHYRIVAVNASGTAYGGDQTFGTPLPPPTVTVGSFAMYFRGHTVNNGHLHLSEIIVIGARAGEQVSYKCQRCYGSPTHASRHASTSKVTFVTRSLVVTPRSLMQVSVVGANGSKRVRTYGFSVARGETDLKSERCFLPGSPSPVTCPGTSSHRTTTPGATHRRHKKNSRRHSRAHHKPSAKHKKKAHH
jgi:streptogramin lyase